MYKKCYYKLLCTVKIFFESVNSHARVIYLKTNRKGVVRTPSSYTVTFS